MNSHHRLIGPRTPESSESRPHAIVALVLTTLQVTVLLFFLISSLLKYMFTSEIIHAAGLLLFLGIPAMLITVVTLDLARFLRTRPPSSRSL